MLIATAIPQIRATDAPPRELQLAVEKLAQARSYAWTQTLRGPDYKSPVVVKGTTERDGFTVVEFAVEGSVNRSVRKGEYFSVNQFPDGRWQTSDEAHAILSKSAGREFPRRTNPRPPADDLQRLLPHLVDFRISRETITATISEAGVAERYTLGVMKPVRTHEAEATFWLKNGTIEKYELRFRVDVVYRGKNEQRRLVQNVEISQIESAIVKIPPGALAKLQASAPAAP